MNSILTFIKRHPQVTFWGIAYLTFFLGAFMDALYPSDLWNFVVWGPFLGGALVTGIVDGRAGLKTYFSRIVRWRVGLKWYAVALFLPLAMRLVAFGLNIVSGATLSPNIQWSAWPDFIMELVIVFFIIALGEEPGFRGFALPRLLVGRSALAASLILGVLHAIWHLPLFISGSESPIIILIIISGAVLITWLFNNTNGSVLMVMLLHFSVNLWVGVFNPLFSEADAARQTTWLVVVYIAVAVILVLMTGPNLARKPAQPEVVGEPVAGV
ncbi:MAG TPA: type II CAAX endopeptidase family protein [Anaerolineae bacterium]|nr:type II CAAX endopeptidase family protein [Anaerolineae bacterium]